MRVAVILTGALRTIKSTVRFLRRNILEAVGPGSLVDVYACIQNDTTTTTNSEWEAYLHTALRGHLRQVEWYSPSTHEDWQIIKARLLKRLEGPLAPLHYAHRYLGASGSMLEYYQLYLAYLHMQEAELLTGDKYDYIIRTRTDSVFLRPVHFKWLQWSEADVFSRWERIDAALTAKSGTVSNSEIVLQAFMSTLLFDDPVPILEGLFMPSSVNLDACAPLPLPTRDTMVQYLRAGKYMLTLRRNNLYIVRREYYKLQPIALAMGYGTLTRVPGAKDHWWNAEEQFRAANHAAGLVLYDYNAAPEDLSVGLLGDRWKPELFFDAEGESIHRNAGYFVVRKSIKDDVDGTEGMSVLKVPRRAHDHNHILLLVLAVDKDAAHLKRCLLSALPHVDAVALVNAGLSDEGLGSAQECLMTCGKPFKIYLEPFVSYGVSKTSAFYCAQAQCTLDLGWDPASTYILVLDADMQFCPSADFRSAVHLKDPGYSIVHVYDRNGTKRQTRCASLLQCAAPWVCKGSVFEYWTTIADDDDGAMTMTPLPLEIVHIDTDNAGLVFGVEPERLDQVICLLATDLAHNPENTRAMHYLGYTLYKSGRFKEAIGVLEKRSRMERGDVQERWSACYHAGLCYLQLKQGDEAETWMCKAFDIGPSRAEPLYHITKFFREHGQTKRAYQHYLKGRGIPLPTSEDALFVETEVYTGGRLEYENTILAYYVHPPAERARHQREMIQYLSTYSYCAHHVLGNLYFYVKPVAGIFSRLLLPDKTTASGLTLKASSCSLIPYALSSQDKNKQFLLNVRYVSYTYNAQGCIEFAGEIRNANDCLFLNEACFPSSDPMPLKEMEYDIVPGREKGLQDVRLFYHQGKLHYAATCANITSRIVMVYGEYDAERLVIGAPTPMISPKGEGAVCEKNWIYVPHDCLVTSDKSKMNFIYGWHPLQIGAVDPSSRKLVIHTEVPTPRMFQHFRGSTSVFEYDGDLFAVVHHVKYATPRVYMHSLVHFEKGTMRVRRYTTLFYFRTLAIEYCLGAAIQNCKMTVPPMITFVFSQFDRDPALLHASLDDFDWIVV